MQPGSALEVVAVRPVVVLLDAEAAASGCQAAEDQVEIHDVRLEVLQVERIGLLVIGLLDFVRSQS